MSELPETTAARIAPNGIVDLAKSPAGILDDAAFDSLFPAEGSTTVLAPQSDPNIPPTVSTTNLTPVEQPQSAPVSESTASSNEPFLKGEKSVYKTMDAAVQGINQKDAIIDQLRQRYALSTGIDPITGQPVGSQSSVVPDYNRNPQKYMADLYEASQNSPEAYVGVQQKFLMDSLAPLQPLMQRTAREQAKETLKADFPEAPAYIGTPAYQKALDTNPTLKEAINGAENDYRFHSRLPELYRLAYLTGQGLQLPELLQAAKSQPQSTTQNSTTTVRPTSRSTTTAPQQTAVRPNFKTLEGIRAIIADAEGKGAKLDF